MNTEFCYENSIVETALANLERSFPKLAEQLKKLLDNLTPSNFQTAENLVDNKIVETYKSILYEHLREALYRIKQLLGMRSRRLSVPQ